MRPILLAALGLLALSHTALAAPAKKTKAAPLVCPVTGETIASVKDAAGSSVYKGKTYYFCCSSCKPTFDADPKKYVKTTAVQGSAH